MDEVVPSWSDQILFGSYEEETGTIFLQLGYWINKLWMYKCYQWSIFLIRCHFPCGFGACFSLFLSYSAPSRPSLGPPLFYSPECRYSSRLIIDSEFSDLRLTILTFHRHGTLFPLFFPFFSFSYNVIWDGEVFWSSVWERGVQAWWEEARGNPGHVYIMEEGSWIAFLFQVAADLVRRLHLEAHVDKPVATYSGGTRRKLSTALALVGKPDILLLVSGWNIRVVLMS